MSKKIRLNADVTPKVKERIERLKTLTEADTLTEVIRRSLAVYETIVNHNSNGGQIILKDAEIEKVLLLD